MKTIQDFKNKLKAYKESGKKIELSQTQNGELRTSIRTVSKVQTNKVAFLSGVRESWLDFPNKQSIKFVDENTVVITAEGFSGTIELTYKFLQ